MSAEMYSGALTWYWDGTEALHLCWLMQTLESRLISPVTVRAYGFRASTFGNWENEARLSFSPLSLSLSLSLSVRLPIYLSFTLLTLHCKSFSFSWERERAQIWRFKCLHHSLVVTLLTTRLDNKKYPHYAHTVYLCFVWISEQTALISLRSINWLVFIIEAGSVYCAVRPESFTHSSG